MDISILNGLTSFSSDNINEVYDKCYFKLIEACTSIIYEDVEPELRLRITVSEADDTTMLVEDLVTHEVTCISVHDDDSITCEDDNIDEDFCKQVVSRFMNLMNSFVNFAEDNG